MSFDINWQNITNSSLSSQIKDLLNSSLESIELPNYLTNLSITDFSLGSIPPTLTIRQISSPFDEFYQDEMDEEPSKSNISSTISNDEVIIIDDDTERNDKDIQFILEMDYDGDLNLQLQLDLLLNYPSPGFIKLPIKFKISGVSIHSLIVVSYINKNLFVSFLCDLDDEFTQTNINKKNDKRIDIIKSLRIESEIGDGNLDNDGNILRNVGKVERFITDLIRDLVRDELAWPGWLNLDFGDV